MNRSTLIDLGGELGGEVEGVDTKSYLCSSAALPPSPPPPHAHACIQCAVYLSQLLPRVTTAILKRIGPKRAAVLKEGRGGGYDVSSIVAAGRKP